MLEQAPARGRTLELRCRVETHPVPRMMNTLSVSEELNMLAQQLSPKRVEMLLDGGLNQVLGRLSQLINTTFRGFSSTEVSAAIESSCRIVDLVVTLTKQRHRVATAATLDLCSEVLSDLKLARLPALPTSERELERARYVHELLESLAALGVYTGGRLSLPSSKWSDTPEQLAHEQALARTFCEQHLDAVLRDVLAIGQGQFFPDVYVFESYRFKPLERLLEVEARIAEAKTDNSAGPIVESGPVALQ
jgi:hypothetical protein